MIQSPPDFFEEAPTLTLYDPLAQFLGSTADGLITYDYASVVALAGHSCPTVASAYLMTRSALEALFPDDTPVRGHIAVEMQGNRSEGVVGVMANVISYLTGAADESGFKGLAGRFQRSERLAFNRSINSEVRFTRLDNGKKVQVSAHLQSVPASPKIPELMPRCVQGHASEEELKQFGNAWQQRVKVLLLEHADDPQVIQLHHE